MQLVNAGSADFEDLCGMGTPPGMIIDPMTGGTHEIDECQLMPG
jgi:hypothetical protein